MRRTIRPSLLLIVAAAIAGVTSTLAAGWEPLLGLDLQGGASVVLEPTRRVDSGVLDQSIEIIRQRVDALGVAEPDIARQGDSIIVQLPGIDDRERALSIVGQTAELRFRPVVNVLPGDGTETTTTTTSSTTTTVPGATTTAVPTTTAAPTTTTAAGETTSTTAAGPTTTTIDPASGITPPEDDLPESEVVLPERDDDGDIVARYVLGPAAATGEIIKSATAVVDPTTGQWTVDFTTTGDGSRKFDEIATANYQRQLAIVLDGVVKSAPTIQQQTFGGKGQISGSFSEREAKDLALVLRYGALPVELERQTVQTVSATLGKDSLNAGLVAGLAGVFLVLLYIVLYYRALGVVVLLGLCVWAALQWTVISFLSETRGLALSLAGVTGIIVSIGVTCDSYIVYFERLKDEVRSGKTIRSSVDRGFARAFRTILAADTSAFIGAFLLYWLTVGPVRGFAFFLGLSTLLDIVVAYCFTRPLVAVLGRSRVFTEARWLGVARGLAARPSEGVA